ncbi:MAG: GAF domain-containing protein, partial [bacterium]
MTAEPAGGEWYASPEGSGEGLFDQIVQIAGSHCGASIAILTLTEERRQWVWSRAGAPGLDPARLNVVACRVAGEPAAFAVCDTLAESCWASDPAISADPPVRACCGAPVLSPGGHVIGFLCVLCLDPGDPARAAEVRDTLTTLARLVTGQLQFRRIFYDYETLLGELDRAQVTLKESEESFRMLAEHATD